MAGISRPGVKAGLLFTGVRGPGVEEILYFEHVALKLCRVGPIRGWDLSDCGMWFRGIQGRFFKSNELKEASMVIQSFASLWAFQSTILDKWQAQKYFCMSGSPIPPFCLGLESCSKLILGLLCFHRNWVHFTWKDLKKAGGIAMGIVCNVYNKRGRMFIFSRAALPNQEKKELPHLSRSAEIDFKIGGKLTLNMSVMCVGR